MSDGNIRPFRPPGKKRSAAREAGGDDAPPGRWPGEDCPVTALGFHDGRFYFTTVAGEIRALSDREVVNRGPVLALLAGEVGWLRRHFGQKTRIFKSDEAGACLIQMCHKAGHFDPTIPMRGRGVWRGPEGQVVVHAGTAVVVDGAERAPGFRLGRAIYRATPPGPRPAAEPASADDGRALVAAIGLWEFKDQGAAILVAGWIAQAFLGALRPWRAHLSVSGEAGSGKSTLFDLIDAALGCAFVANDASAAGLRQTLSSEARPMLLDEAEGGPDRMKDVIELIRLMSSGAGAKITRGSPGGGAATTFDVVGSVYLSAIQPPELPAQDASRITNLELGDPDPAKRAAAIAAIGRARELSSRFWRRMIDGAARMEQTFKTVAAILTVEEHIDSRRADQLGTLLAGYSTLTADSPASEEDAQALIKSVAFAIDHGDLRADKAPDLVLQHLYGSMPDLWRAGARPTVGEMLGKARAYPESDHHDDLARMGLRFDFSETGDPRGLLIANAHPALRAIYARTDWKDGFYRHLQRLWGAGRVGPTNFKGMKSRATFLPIEHLPAPDVVESKETEPQVPP